ncbi:hypothetical protein FQR65_LT04791 [Abscondita terminalis]|nr:hypothetical protein FQR65_LT04791 [Abscondita terminalis]
MHPLLLIKDLITLDFNKSVSSWFTFLGFVAMTPLDLKYFVHQKQINDLLEKLEQEPFLPRDDSEYSFMLKWYRLKNIKVFLLASGIIGSSISQFGFALLTRLSKEDSKDWKLGYGQFVNVTYSPNFEIVCVYESVSVFCSCGLCAIVISIITSLLDFISTQFKILQYNLKVLLHTVKQSLPKKDLANNNILWAAVNKKIKSTVIYHITITDMLKEIESMFGNGMLCLYIAIQSMVCVEIYQASLLSLQDIRTYRLFYEGVSMSFALFVVCKAGQEVVYQNDLIASAIYEIDFVGTDIRFQKSLVLLMRQTQKPIRIMGGKFVEISLITFAKAVLFLGSIVASVLSQTLYSLFLRLTRTDPNDWKMGYGELLNITYSPNFEIVFVYETVSVIYSTMIASTIIVIIVGVLDYITTQFKILQHNLQMLLMTADESLKQDTNVNEISWEFLQKEIKKCVLYHISITNILKEFEEIFSYGIFFIFLSIQSMICIDTYRASILSVQDLRTYRIFVEIMAVSIGLFLINMAGEKMTYECGKICNAIYEINFLGTDIRFQKSLIVIMRQSQRPVRIKAGKFIDISLVSFAKVQ